MPQRALALTIAFRGRDYWQRPFREGDTLRVYRLGDAELVAELPAAFLLDLVAHYLTGLALQHRIADHLGPAPVPVVTARPRSVPRLPAAHGRRLRGRP